MKRLLFTIAKAYIHFQLFAQKTAECNKGDCQNGYSFAKLLGGDAKEYGYQVSFYESGKLNGISNQTGKIWGAFYEEKKYRKSLKETPKTTMRHQPT